MGTTFEHLAGLFPAATTMPSESDAVITTHGPAYVAGSYREISEECWRSAFGAHCKDARFYEIVERTLPDQFAYRYFILKNERTSAFAIQPFFFVEQDLIAGLPSRVRSAADAVRKVFPRFLKLKMMMVGCAAAEGHLDCADAWAVEALHEASTLYARRAKASVVLLKDFPSTYRDTLARFSNDGYSRLPSMPAAKLDLSFASFEDYLRRRVGKTFRKNLRRKFRHSARFPAMTMEVVSDGSPFATEIHALYLQTHERSKMQFEKLTQEYFAEVGKRMPDRVRFFLWRQNGRIIAFNLCMVHEGTLYDLDVGMDYSVALDMHLYFVTWRDIVQWAIKNGLKTYHTGPLNYDPKLHLRMELVPQDLYVRHSSAWLNPLFKIAGRFLQPVRHEPTLRRFPNAHDL
jgi:Acetyltransferase (GNAT) domain